jgi:hypothetical protein
MILTRSRFGSTCAANPPSGEAQADSSTVGRPRAGRESTETGQIPLDPPGRAALGRFVIAEVERYLAGQPLEGEVTLDAYDRLA